MDFLIRPMLLKDLPAAMVLSHSEGWNQTEKDWKILLDNSINTCLVGEFKGRVIGTATAINYSNLAGWIGMVLVDREFRRLGLGRSLVTKIIDRLHNFKSIKLDATPAGQPVYQKLGFIEERLLCRMTNISFKGISSDLIDSVPLPVKHDELEELIKFDHSVFGSDRSYLLGKFLTNYPEKAFVLKRNARISGYILGRNGVRYNYLGPVFANSTEDAKLLIARGLYDIDNQNIAIDVQTDKSELITWLESIGFVMQRQFVRMYLNKNPFPGKVENQYLIIGPEFG
jgi:GNAT superfamily N-acetyltransferase